MPKYQVTFINTYIVDGEYINSEDLIESAKEAVYNGYDEEWYEATTVTEVGLQ